MTAEAFAGPVGIPLAAPNRLEGDLHVPGAARGIVLFAHGSGSSRFSRRNVQVATALRAAGMATLLMDLLTAEEERVDAVTRHLRFDVDLLAARLVVATDWLRAQSATSGLRIGYFGASTGAAAALIAAAERPDVVAAVVSRGGRPDLAHARLPDVRAPTLLIVGGLDEAVIAMNREAFAVLGVEKRLDIVPGATHLFEEPGTLEEVTQLARDWFADHFAGTRGPAMHPGLAGNDHRMRDDDDERSALHVPRSARQ